MVQPQKDQRQGKSPACTHRLQHNRIRHVNIHWEPLMVVWKWLPLEFLSCYYNMYCMYMY
jgi:hypothetical protein